MRAVATAALLCLLAGCRHATAAAAAPAPRVAEPWDEHARLVYVLPDGTPPRRGFWRRAWEVLVGVSDDDAPETLSRPFGVAAVGPAEFIVTDPDSGRVLRVRRGEEPEELGCGKGGAGWVSPMAVAAAPGGELWVADSGAGTVVRRAPDGTCIAFGAGTLVRPTGVAVAGGRVYVADPPRHQVAVYSTAGQGLASLGGHGDADGQLNFPSSLAVAPDGTLLVVDTLNFRVAHLAPDGAWLGSFGTPGDEGGAFARPKAIALSADGRIFVSDAQRDEVLVFSYTGAFEFAFGATGDGAGRFAHPAGVAVTGKLVAVADSLNRRVQVFEVNGDPR